MPKPILWFALIAAAAAVLVWLGLNLKPAKFTSYPEPSGTIETVPLPKGLPAPVDRFYRQVYGEQIPVYSSIIFTGRGPLRPFGPFYFQGRFRFTHVIGRGYRHYIEMTFMGLPILKINERYVDGESLFELPFGIVDQGTKLEAAANQGLWAELSNTPAALLTDPRVRWEPVDDQTAILYVPFEDGEQSFIARFDPDTGLLKYLETMRYKASDSPSKTLWITERVNWGALNGQPIGVVGQATWYDQGEPWAIFQFEDLTVNADLDEYLLQRGP